MKVINLSKYWNRIGSWTRTDPYAHKFVYTFHGKKLLYKGGANDVDSALAKNITEPYVAHSAYFHKGNTRGSVSVENLPSGVKAYMHNNQITVYIDGELIVSKTVKRFPRKFPTEIKTILERYNI